MGYFIVNIAAKYDHCEREIVISFWADTEWWIEQELCFRI